MPAPTVVPMTPGITISDNYIVSVTAISPTTGAVVSGVKVSAVAILGVDLSDTAPNTVTDTPPVVGDSFFAGDSTT